MLLEDMQQYGIGRTRLHHARDYCPTGNLWVKLESDNPGGSVKDRTAYYLLRELIDRGELQRGCTVVESTSGNLGYSLALLAADLDVGVCCIGDETVLPAKLRRLRQVGCDVEVVNPGVHPDARTARIARARELAARPGWFWPNQYDNPAGCRAHAETTGPEIWEQTEGRVRLLVGAVGTGGTLCGAGLALKRRNRNVRVVAVEPAGSTIFGGEPGQYLSADAGLREPSGLVRAFSHVIDDSHHIPDVLALEERERFARREGLSLGVTSGMALAVGIRLANERPDDLIVVIAPDGGENYAGSSAELLPAGAACWCSNV